jgi:hypothetical protein
VYYKTLLSSYPKVIKVIHSCTTISQYNTAIKYVNLYLSRLPPIYNKHLRPKLIDVCDTQKYLIKYKYVSTEKTHHKKRDQGI